jgi:hypothetical protein
LALMSIVVTPGQHIGGLPKGGSRHAGKQKTRYQKLKEAPGGSCDEKREASGYP